MKFPTSFVFSVALVAAGLAAATVCFPTPATADNAGSKTSDEKVVVLAGGCFWCTEAVFERMEGVNDVVSGYMGGKNPNPTYKQVCTGLTNHAEVVEVYYDPAKVSYDELLSLFFKTHDPTTLNQQGNDKGTQYRSSIFYHDEAEKKLAAKYIEKIGKDFRGRIVTQLEKVSTFYPAEEYHQDYFRLNPNAGYCRAIVAKKVRKANNLLGDKAKPKGK